MQMNNGVLRAAKAAGGLIIIIAVMLAFLTRVWRGTMVAPWLVLLVTTLGIAAGVAVLGREAMQMASDIRGDE